VNFSACVRSGWHGIPSTGSACTGSYPEQCRVCRCLSSSTPSLGLGDVEAAGRETQEARGSGDPGTGGTGQTDDGPWGETLFGHTAAHGAVYSTIRCVPSQPCTFTGGITRTHTHSLPAELSQHAHTLIMHDLHKTQETRRVGVGTGSRSGNHCAQRSLHPTHRMAPSGSSFAGSKSNNSARVMSFIMNATLSGIH
jgi:hypothetical protein